MFIENIQTIPFFINQLTKLPIAFMKIDEEKVAK
jgi:hypothetical protein